VAIFPERDSAAATSWLANDEAPGPYITIPQYRFNKTKQHTNGSKNTVVLYKEMWLKVAACEQSAFCSHLATVQLVRSPSWNMKLS